MPLAPEPSRPPASDLPAFTHPPLVAVSLGWRNATPVPVGEVSLKRILSLLGPEWRVRTGIGDSPRVDIEIAHVLGDRLVQMDATGVSFRWLSQQGERYPHYESIRDDFVALLDAWTETFPDCDPAGWDVQYVNAMPRGTVWQTPRDWSFFRPLGNTQLGGEPAALQGFEGTWRYQFTDRRTELLVEWSCQTATTVPPAESAEVATVEVTFTARGRCRSLTELLEGLDTGRELIVRSFSELMTPAAKQWWGLKR